MQKNESKNKSELLLNCPFCGGEATWDFLNGYKTMGWSMVCIQCRSRCGYHSTKENAITAWNTRKPMERIVERLEKLKENAWDEEYQTMCDAIEIVKEEM